MSDLGTLGGSYSSGFAINTSGQVTGFSGTVGNSATHAFLISPPYTSMTDLGTLGGNFSFGSGINASGQVAGYSTPKSSSAYHAFLISPPYTSMTDLGTLGGNFSYGLAINASGQITGFSNTTGDSVHHAFLISSPYTNMTDLGTLGGSNSSALAINASGQVTGFSDTTNNRATHAFLYTPTKGMVDLNSLLPANSGWTLVEGQAINDAGQITGFGTVANGAIHAFVLSPINPYKAFVQPPINADGSSVFIGRGVIPVKFTLRQNGIATRSLPPATISVTRTAGGTLGSIDPSVYRTPADSGSNFRIAGAQYIYNLAASSLGAGTYRVDISIAGNVVGQAVFKLQ
jgi:probable HAF family extracellular repeat protein